MAQKYPNKSHRTSNSVIQYVNDHSLRLHPAQKKLIETTIQHSESEMLGSADEIQLIQNILRAIGAKKTIDIGVYTGYSALSVALILPEDGKVIACDVSEEFAKIGKPFWKEANVDDKIDLRIGPALNTLDQLLKDGQAGTFDFAFIDADKVNYDNYYERCLKLIRKGGIIAVDNTLWSNRVVDETNQDLSTLAIRALNDKLAKDERVDISMLTIGDGTTLLFKR